MPIKVTCQCGKRLTVKDEFAGKRVKCPGCGGPLLVPHPQVEAVNPTSDDTGQLSDLLDDAGVRAGINRCPGCGAEMPDEAVLCVMCGYDLRRGHRIKARVGTAAELDGEDLGDLPVHGVLQLDNAEREMARDKLQQKKLGKGVPWWIILLAFLGVTGFTGGMMAMPQDKVVENSGYVLIVAGSLISFFFGLRLLIAGFKESFLNGFLMVIFFPFWLYYIFSRWDRVGGLFIFLVIGNLMVAMGYGMIAALVPFFESLKEEDKGQGLLLRQNQPAVVMVFQDTTQI